MKLPKLNQKGIAHILAPLLFIVLFAAVGSYVILKSHAASAPNVGFFSPNERSAWENSKQYANLDVSVDSRVKVNKVEWYLNNLKSTSPVATIYKANKINTANHYPYQWYISNLSAGSYHWLAKIYTSTDSYLALNNQGQSYLDALVIGKGSVGGTFVDNQNEVIHRDKSDWLSIDVKIYASPDSVNKVEWYQDEYGHYKVCTATKPTKVENIDSIAQILTYGCKVGLGEGPPNGPLHYTARIYDKSGQSKLATNNKGAYYLTLWLTN